MLKKPLKFPLICTVNSACEHTVVHKDYVHFDKERPYCAEEYVALILVYQKLESMLMTCKEQSRNTCGVRY